MQPDFARVAATALRAENFYLVDLGCAGGIDPAWRVFGDKLRALALDASIDECRRLAAAEKNSAVEYVAAFAGIARDHPFSKRREGREEASRNPWDRLSTAQTTQRNEARLKRSSDQQKIRESIWYLTETADAAKPVSVPDLLRDRGVTNVDFLKIDTDGNDFAILNSFDGTFERLGILGARLEVNFCGAPDDTNRTFHNTDRFMKGQGFELFDLSMRRYSSAALPAKYELAIPAQTQSGRILQGDAIYLRDWAAPYWQDKAEAASADKLLKLAILFAMHGLADCAAEILVRFRPRLGGQLDVEAALDILAATVQADLSQPLKYRDYIAAFEADAPSFYPARSRR
jgi:hypothetical protein